MKARAPLEKEVQRDIVKLLTMFGVAVWNTSQPFAAKITPGVPDLLCICPRRGVFFVECKRPGGKQTPAQRGFQAACEVAGTPYVLGGVDEVAEFLRTYTRRDAA